MTTAYTIINKDLNPLVKAIGIEQGHIIHADDLPAGTSVEDNYAYYAVDKDGTTEQADWYNGFAAAEDDFDALVSDLRENGRGDDADEMIAYCADFGGDYDGMKNYMERCVRENQA